MGLAQCWLRSQLKPFNSPAIRLKFSLAIRRMLPRSYFHGSRTTTSFVSAIQDAAQQLQKQLLQVANRKFHCEIVQ